MGGVSELRAGGCEIIESVCFDDLWPVEIGLTHGCVGVRK